MNRRSIFVALAALWGQRAVAQNLGADDGVVDLVGRYCTDTRGNVVHCPPKPNQCPIPGCGGMAEPYHRPTEAEAYAGMPCGPVPSSGGAAFSVCIAPSETKRVGAMKRVTECPKCRCAFWQTAEGE